MNTHQRDGERVPFQTVHELDKKLRISVFAWLKVAKHLHALILRERVDADIGHVLGTKSRENVVDQPAEVPRIRATSIHPYARTSSTRQPANIAD